MNAEVRLQMVFSSMTFLWVFLPLLLITYFLTKDRFKNYILLCFSLVFYAWGEPKYIFLMIASVVVNYSFGRLIDKLPDGGRRRFTLICSIIFNLGLLGYFKYFNFLTDNINGIFGTDIAVKKIALPIGISFFTFQIMSYVIDLYRREIAVQKNICDLSLYIFFFPQLIAGPIVKYRDIASEMRNRTVTLDGFVYGTRRFVYGLAKKVLIANAMALAADSIFDTNAADISTLQAWVGSIAYTMQIYYDFSGYSDMAIGLGRMFGFTFSENFDLPYVSGSITEFWRRWHISLSTWFREYVYIPLGGNRKGKIRTYINLWTVFILTGIWHGASWTFVVWGLYHGFFIFIERLGLKKKLDRLRVLNHIYTLLVVNFGWVLFRAEDFGQALTLIKNMFVPTAGSSAENIYAVVSGKFILLLVTAILFSCIVQKLYARVADSERVKRAVRTCEPIAIAVLWVLCILSLASNTYNPFIYFRF